MTDKETSAKDLKFSFGKREVDPVSGEIPIWPVDKRDLDDILADPTWSEIAEAFPASAASFTDMTVSQLLDCLKQDFELLQSGEWVPDSDSCEASIEVVQRIRELVT